MKEYGLTKKERLHRDKIIKNLFENGESGFAYPFRYYFLINRPEVMPVVHPAPDCTDIRPSGNVDMNITNVAGSINVMDSMDTINASVLFSVPKRMFRRANKRNLLKRRMREAYRLNKAMLRIKNPQSGTHIDIALVYAVKELSDYKVVENGIKKALKTICKAL